jgi:HAD superfamily hydrolase (TIGR01509 family)
MNIIKNKIKAIIFDMDGTIIKTENIWQNITYQVLASYNITQFTQKHKDLFNFTISGIGLLQCAKILKTEFNLSDSVNTVMQAMLTQAYKHFSSNEKNIQFVEGFENFAQKLVNTKISTSIATNADIKTLNALSQKMQFNRFFGKKMYSQDHVNNMAKPDPALFLYAAKQLNARPEECIVFEDSIHGFKAAKEAGMKCIAIKTELNKGILNHADQAIKNYHEAEIALKKIVNIETEKTLRAQDFKHPRP